MPEPESQQLKQAAAMDALRASEERFRLAADFTHDWEYWEGPDGSIVYVSPSCTRITGYSADEFLREPELFTRIVHPDDRAALGKHREQERRGPGSHSLNYRIVDRAGQVRWIGHVCQAVHDASGTWLGWRGSNRDITEQVLTEQALAQAYEELEVTSEELRAQNEELLVARQALDRQRQRYQELFDLAPDGYLVTDLRGVVQEANRAAATLLCTDQITLMGQTLDRYLFPADRPTYYDYLEQLQRDTAVEPLRWEILVKPLQREPFHAHLSVAAGRDPAGHKPSLRWLIRDETEHKRAEDALREGEAKLQALFEILPVGISILDAEHHVRYTNPALSRILDLPVQDLVEGRYSQRTYLHPAGRPMAAGEFPSARAFAEQQTVRDVEVGVVKEDGSLIWTNVSAVPLPFADWSVILVTADVTEKVQARQRIVELAAEAQRRADELDAVFASLTDAVVVYDVEGNLIKANGAALSALGHNVVGQNLAEFTPASVLQSSDIPLEVHSVPAMRALRGETMRNQRLVFANAAGQETSMLVSAAPLYAGGAISGSVAVWHDVTQVEEAQRHRDRLIAILEATPDFVSTARPDGQVLYYNQAARHILGIDPDADVTGFRIPAGQPEWAGTLVEKEGIPAAMRDGIWQGHTVMVDTAGREIPASQIILAHKGSRGEVEYLSTIAHDVSREQEVLAQAQEARQAAEEQAALLDTMLASLAEMVILYGPDTRIIRANPAASALFAFRPDDNRQSLAEQITWTTPIYENGEPIPLDELPAMRALCGETVNGLVLGLRLGPGPLIWLSASAAPVIGPGGVLMGAIVSLVDITALRQASEELERRVRERTADLWRSNQALQSEIVVRCQAEADLRESELRFRQLSENVDEVFCLWEPGTRQVLYMSPSYEAVWGRPVEEAYRQPDAVLAGVHVDDLEHVRALWEDISTNHDTEFRVLRPDDSLRWVRGRTFLVEHEGGMAPRIAAIGTDITGQKEAQAAMIRADRLTITGQLAASLAHEINNPLQSAVGCLDLAFESIDSARNPRRFLEVVSEALERAAEVVSQLRCLHRQFRDEEPYPVDLGDLLEQVMVRSQKKWQSQGVEVILQLDPDLPLLALQGDAMQQVFLNMVLNALDAMPHGGELRIEVQRSYEPGGVWIRFADTGIGLPADVREHLFEPFRSNKSEGLGLGLFISQNIVQQHNGRIEVESREGEGTVFGIWLPS